GREEARYLPRIGAGLHKPRRRRVLQCMRCDICDAGAITGGGKSLLDIFDALAVDVQDVAEIGPAFPQAMQMRQKARRGWNDPALLVCALPPPDVEIDGASLQVYLRPTQRQDRLFPAAGVKPDQDKMRQVESSLRRSRRSDHCGGFFTA